MFSAQRSDCSPEQFAIYFIKKEREEFKGLHYKKKNDKHSMEGNVHYPDFIIIHYILIPNHKSI